MGHLQVRLVELNPPYVDSLRDDGVSVSSDHNLFYNIIL